MAGVSAPSPNMQADCVPITGIGLPDNFSFDDMVLVMGWMENLSRAYATPRPGNQLTNFHQQSKLEGYKVMNDMREKYMDFLFRNKALVSDAISCGHFGNEQVAILETARLTLYPEFARVGHPAVQAYINAHAPHLLLTDKCQFTGQPFGTPDEVYFLQLSANVPDIFLTETFAVSHWNQATNSNDFAIPNSASQSLTEYEAAVTSVREIVYTDYDIRRTRLVERRVYSKCEVVVGGDALRFIIMLQQLARIEFPMINALHPCMDKAVLDERRDGLIWYASALMQLTGRCVVEPVPAGDAPSPPSKPI